MVAAAIVGSAVVGAVASDAASSKGENAANRATDAASATATENAALGREQLDFTKQQYADSKPFRDAASDLSLKVGQRQLDSQQQSDELAADYANYNKTTFRPLEQGIVADAAGFDTPERRQAAADSAVSDTNAAFAGTTAARARSLAANGINPGSARAMAADTGADVDQAKAMVSAAHQARSGIETQGFARKMDAASLGRNLPSAQATSAGVAINAGNSAVTNAMNGITANNAGVSGVQAGYAGAVNALGSAASIYGNVANLAQRGASDSAALWGQLGSTTGTAAARYGTTGGKWNGTDFTGVSDENLKTDIEPMSDEEALEATNATPISKWKYDPAKMAAQDIPMGPEDEGVQVGGMAQDIQQTMGDSASNGKRVNPVTMNGIAMKGVQAVDKKVERLTKEVATLASMIRGGRMQARAAA